MTGHHPFHTDAMVHRDGNRRRQHGPRKFYGYFGELTMDELDAVAGGMDTQARLFAAACLLNASFMVGALVAMAVLK